MTTTGVETSGRADHHGRHQRLGTRLNEAGLDAYLLVAGSDLRWLSGFTGSTATAIVTAEEILVIVDGRYRDQAVAECEVAGAPIHVAGIATLSERDETVARYLQGRARVAVDPATTTLAEHQRLVGVLGRSVETHTSLCAPLRRRKEPVEIDAISRACAIADQALASVIDLIDSTQGVTEVDLRDELEYRMRRLGAQGPSYPTIVASGPRHAARAHHQPVPKPLEEGDTLVIDVGALVDGYHSDTTRTFVVGDATPRQRELYEIVARAQQAGLDVLAPGVLVAHLDATCREVITQAGLGEWFSHGTSHGVGLDIHEAPFSTPSSTASGDVFEVGDVVTVEPGVYRDGFGGIRIEDLVVLTETGHRVLTSSPKDDPCPPSPPTT